MKNAFLFRDTTMSQTEIQNANAASSIMGYNYEIQQVSAYVSTDTNYINLDVTVSQIGIAPFYYPLSLQASCMNHTYSRAVVGVETLIEQFESKIFTIQNIAVNEGCLKNITFSLQATDNVNRFYKSNPIKFAQGRTGIVQVSIPLPSSVSRPIPIVVPVVPPPPRPTTMTVPVMQPVVPVPQRVPTSKPVTVIGTTPILQPSPTIPMTGPSPSLPQAIIQFILVDAGRDTVIKEIKAGDVYNSLLLGNQLTILAEVIPIAPRTKSDISEVTFTYVDDDNNLQIQTERSLPYCLGSNSETDYSPVPYLATNGIKTISAVAKKYIENDTNTITLASLSLSFTINDGAPPNDQVPNFHFVLIDTDSNMEYGTMTDGQIIDLAKYSVDTKPSNLGMRLDFNTDEK
jgi:hypothetical protein